VIERIFKTKKVRKSDSKVFFVRGFQRSGTNWVCNLLNLHPEIACVGEFHFKHFFEAQKLLTDRPYIKHENKVTWLNKEFINFIEKIIKEHAGYNLWCGDRTPCAIEDALIENRKYIIIHRDGRDCLISWIYHLFRIDAKHGEEMENKKEIFKRDPEYFEQNKKTLLNRYWTKKIARQWNYRILQDLKTIEAANIGQLDIECKFITYESLFDKTDIIRKELYQFLGVDSNTAKPLTSKTTPGFEMHQPNEHNRIGMAGRWKEYFTEEQLKWFEDSAYEALNKLNYPIYTNQKQNV